jgi:hypothetical protein
MVLVTRIALLLVFTLAAYAAAAHDFSMPGHSILHDDEDLGIVNGRITCGVSKEFLGRINGIWAPPLVSSDCAVRWLLNGEELKLDSFTWNPGSVSGAANAGKLKVEFSVWLREDRAIVQAIRVHASGPGPHEFDLALKASGSLDVVQRWEFARATSTSPTKDTVAPSGLVLRNGDEALAVQCHDLTPKDGTLSGHFLLRDGDAVTLLAAIAVGSADDAVANTEFALQAVRAEKDPLAPRKVDTPLSLPTFTSDNPALDAFFSRSLVHLIMNRWTVPEFKLNPYYATGSVKGGCLCNYLWNFGEVWEILPMLDPAATKAHIKQFLACNLTEHFAFDPIGGEAFGPWYMVNQEKIIGLIYFYTLISGDTAFLHEKVDDKTIAEHAVAHSLAKDDPAQSVALIDYGPSNSHLELRREYAYNHVMPDLNGRRYDNLVRAEAIARWAGTPQPELRTRAEELKAVLTRELWDADAKWFRFINGEGKPELRYTIQMFKLFNSGVLGTDQVTGLLSHFNEREFFSQYGMHSMSKLDPAYDQVDIDNGGGGSCTCFPPQFAERLYKAGHTAEADDILRRILWWGNRMPYWGDSIVANEMAYRKDTPLQCTIDGATVAQCIIFGLFGIAPQPDGRVTISPRKSSLFSKGTLGDIRLRGHEFSVEMDGDAFAVITKEATQRARLGEAIMLK